MVLNVPDRQPLGALKRPFHKNLITEYKIPVTSIAVLADNSLSWNPGSFQYGMWGSIMGLNYLKRKLLDYKPDWHCLENEDNPFAIVVMAHLKALETKHHPEKTMENRADKTVISQRLFTVRNHKSVQIH